MRVLVVPELAAGQAVRLPGAAAREAVAGRGHGVAARRHGQDEHTAGAGYARAQHGGERRLCQEAKKGLRFA